MRSPSRFPRRYLQFLGLCTLLPWVAQAEVKLPAIFGDHMVLQRDMKIPVWGWAAAGEKVSVKLDQGTPVETTADPSGKWRVELPAQPAGAPREITVTGTNTVTLKDVLFGEVWLCSGQSNMEWVVQNTVDSAKEIAAADFPTIRHIKVPLVPSGTPQENFAGSWQVCSPATAAWFTAAGFYMARELQKELKVPVGLINASWGGTRIEPWVPAIGFSGLDKLRDIDTQIQLKLPANPQYKQRLEKYVGEIDAWSKT
ncbi:MAG: 9-O-acetylesterase, partial [Verrucomicrobium sp.]